MDWNDLAQDRNRWPTLIGIDGKIILKGMFKKWTGMIWLRIGTGGRRL